MEADGVSREVRKRRRKKRVRILPYTSSMDSKIVRKF